jgi:hypothetical protein
MTEDKATHRYCIVQWTSMPYTLQEETDEFQEVKLVCDATYLNPIGCTRNWYTPGTGTVETNLIQIQHVVIGDIQLLQPSAMVKLPQTCNQHEEIKRECYNFPMRHMKRYLVKSTGEMSYT